MKERSQFHHAAQPQPSTEAIRMLIGERRNHILSLVHRDGRVLVSELSESLGISPITIRKDLDHLEAQGVVQRTHGGALSTPGQHHDRPFPPREGASVYLKLVNASSTIQPVTIELTGATDVAKTGTLITLAGNSHAETNTISTPTRIVPVQTVLKDGGATFTHTMPPYSIQVLELQAK
ncbi:MAG: DeoR family transcriptional regulator [Edaphobacter sp.]